MFLKKHLLKTSIILIQILFLLYHSLIFCQSNYNNQGSNSYDASITYVDQVDFIEPIADENSTTAFFTIQYDPGEEQSVHYMNIVAKSFLTPHDDTWVGQNIALIPFDDLVNFTYAFDLSLLGTESGDDVIEIIMGFIVTDTIQLNRPTINEENFYLYDVGNFECNIGDGFEFPELEPGGEITPFEHDWSLATDDTWVYRGCKVPNVDLDYSEYPFSPTYWGDVNACPMAACANSLGWLEGEHKEIDTHRNGREKLQLIDELMDRSFDDFVIESTEEYIKGTLAVIDSLQLPISVKYQSYTNTSPTIPSKNPKYGHSATNQGVRPNNPQANQVSWDWIVGEMEAGEDVTVVISTLTTVGWYGGHAVTLTGISKDAANKKLTYKDDKDQRGPGGTSESQIDVREMGAWLVTNFKYGNPGIKVITDAFSKSYDPNVTFEETSILHGNKHINEKNMLFQSYPNPFNSMMKFRFYLEKTGHVVLKIYNLRGEEIETPIQGLYSAGMHEKEWFAKDLPSGMYLYRLETQDFTETKKFILQR